MFRLGYIMVNSLDKLQTSKINATILLVIWGSLYILSTNITMQYKSQLPDYVYTALSLSSTAFILIGLFYAIRLFKINRVEVNNPELAKQLYDEREKLIRAKCAANGFITCIITYSAYITIAMVMKVLFTNNSVIELNGIFVGALMLVTGYLAAVFSYKKMHQE